MLADSESHPKLKLASLWASVMFCYIYGDFFGLFAPGTLANMNQGIISPLGRATDTVLIGVSLMMTLPALMIFLSIALPARANRALNAVMGTVYTAIISLTMWGGPMFFVILGVVEIALTLLVVYYARTWPRGEGSMGVK